MSKKLLTAAERVIISADIWPLTKRGRDSVRSQVMQLAEALQDTGVFLKVNSALRACGYDLIDEIHACNLKVFADLKLFDIPKTLNIDGALLAEVAPEMVTVSCTTEPDAIRLLKKHLTTSKTLGVTLPTSFDEDECHDVFGLGIRGTIRNQVLRGIRANVDGFTLSANEVESIRELTRGKIIVTPGIRPRWSKVYNDDQNAERVTTPEKAILAGADYIVIGRPITMADNPHEATLRVIDEVNEAIAKVPAYS